MVLRRYHGADRVLWELIVGEAADLPPEALQEILRTQGPIVDHLTAAISKEHTHELERSRRSPAERLGKRLRALIDGDRDEDPSLTYPLGGWHVGLIASGDDIEGVIRNVAKGLDCQVLCAPATGGDAIWGWLGGRSKPSPEEIEKVLSRDIGAAASVALGEAHKGIEGWRLTHQEAKTALYVLPHCPQAVIRCRDVILLSAIIRDPLLTTSLIETFLRPLEGRNDRGAMLRRTLQAYFAANRNVAASAAALGVSRNTIERRVHAVEASLGQTLESCCAQLQVALAAEKLVGPSGKLQHRR
jgi:hypothetical protein